MLAELKEIQKHFETVMPNTSADLQITKLTQHAEGGHQAGRAVPSGVPAVRGPETGGREEERGAGS